MTPPSHRTTTGAVPSERTFAGRRPGERSNGTYNGWRDGEEPPPPATAGVPRRPKSPLPAAPAYATAEA